MAPVAAAAWAIRFGWTPAGDDGLLAIRSWDALHGDLPLLGMPSTLRSPVEGVLIHHPGPAPFYVLAPFTSLTEAPWGVVLGVLAVHLTAVVLAFGSARRLGGAKLASLAMLAVVVLEATLGTQLLYRPFNTFLPLLVYVALALALAEVLGGRARSLVLVAVLGSLTAQAHLSGLGPTAVVVGAAVVGYLRILRRAGAEADAERGEGTEDAAGAATPAAEARRDATRWALVALAIAVVGWLPVLWQQLTQDPGNLWAIQGGLRAHRSTLGAGDGLSLAARVVGLPAPLGLPRTSSDPSVDLSGPLGTSVLAFVPLALLGALGWWHARSRAPRPADHPRVQAVLVTGALSWGVLTVSAVNAPERVYYQVVALWPLAVVVWLAIAWGAWRALDRRTGERPGRDLWIQGVAVAIAVVVVAAAVAGSPLSKEADHRQAEIRTARALDRAVRGAGVEGPVTVVVRGGDAFGAGAPVVVGALARQGHDVYVDEPFRDHIRVYGDRAPIAEPTERLIVASGPAPIEAPDGYREVARIPAARSGHEYALFLSDGPVPPPS